MTNGTTEISSAKLMEEIGISKEEADNIPKDVSQYLEYDVDGDGELLYVEICAPNLCVSLLAMPVSDQKKFFGALLKRVPEVGDQLIITDRKQRGARVVRMKGVPPAANNLLLTR